MARCARRPMRKRSTSQFNDRAQSGACPSNACLLREGLLQAEQHEA
eukprot:CAMPEP_0115438302 /NCGR_PEP_ID=MMETSP0271-20121206/35186_1 /TAXON_ID=71861 /ORGANISM="Scrippsiella trochoidea, Strain CCMP3099" /LENGTH=45 /DNA_ID= /DNA_START= /DNA_END= /DNA_ORIENTATION=